MPLLVLTSLLPEERSKGCRCDKEYSPHPREARAELDVRTTTPASGRALSAVAQPWSTRDPDGERLLVAGELSKIFELAVPACRDRCKCNHQHSANDLLTLSPEEQNH